MSQDYDAIRNLIAKTIDGFADYNQKIQNDSGFYLPNGPRVATFTTDTGLAKFTNNQLVQVQVHSDEFLLMTIRSHDQFNTTVYGLNDRYRGIFNERRIIFISEKDLLKHHLSEYDIVNMYSTYNNTVRTAQKFILIKYQIPEGNLAAYFPEANTVVPIDSYADKSHTPTSKSVVVKLEKVGYYDKISRKAIF